MNKIDRKKLEVFSAMRDALKEQFGDTFILDARNPKQDAMFTSLLELPQTAVEYESKYMVGKRDTGGLYVCLEINNGNPFTAAYLHDLGKWVVGGHTETENLPKVIYHDSVVAVADDGSDYYSSNIRPKPAVAGHVKVNHPIIESMEPYLADLGDTCIYLFVNKAPLMGVPSHHIQNLLAEAKYEAAVARGAEGRKHKSGKNEYLLSPGELGDFTNISKVWNPENFTIFNKDEAYDLFAICDKYIHVYDSDDVAWCILHANHEVKAVGVLEDGKLTHLIRQDLKLPVWESYHSDVIAVPLGQAKVNTLVCVDGKPFVYSFSGTNYVTYTDVLNKKVYMTPDNPSACVYKGTQL